MGPPWAAPAAACTGPAACHRASCADAPRHRPAAWCPGALPLGPYSRSPWWAGPAVRGDG
eukprot:3018160-Lingulodinium_polyedra.AAC.1